MRHPTPPPIPTLDHALFIIDMHRGELETLAECVGEEREKNQANRDDVIRIGERLETLRGDLGVVRAKIEDQSQAIHALRRRDSQLLMLGALAAILLGALARGLLGG